LVKIGQKYRAPYMNT